MNKEYYSIYGPYLEQYIDMKRKLGFKYSTGAVILSQIDALAYDKTETSLGITKEFASEWSKRRAHESAGHQYTRIRHLAHFSSYLCDIGIRSYIPKVPPAPKHRFIPHIYSQKELTAIFKAVDGLRIEMVHKKTPLLCMPAIIRLLYCTGIRVGEALALKDEDVNLEEAYLKIRDSKNGKERIIPISTSMVNVCKTFKTYRNQLNLCKKKSSYFFINLEGEKCSWLSVSNWFKRAIEIAKIPHHGGKHGPRLHDLRHTFAVTSLASMAESGLDLYVSLPILSNYLGHQSLESTEHYVRLTANRYPDLIKDVNLICLNVFPKFNNDEAN